MGFESIDQSSWSSEVNIIKKWAFHFFGRRGVADGVWVHQPAWLIIRSKHNPKRSISFYWLERAGRWTLSQLTSLADHQKLNVIENWAFHFYGWRGLADEVQVHQSARQIIRRERNPKTSISFFLAGEGWQMAFESINQPGWSSEVNIIQKETFHFIGCRGVVGGVWVHQPVWPTSEVEHNQNMSISFFCLETGGGWGSSPLTSPADYQKLNVIQKWAFHFIGWRGLADGVWVHWTARLIIRSWM